MLPAEIIDAGGGGGEEAAPSPVLWNSIPVCSVAEFVALRAGAALRGFFIPFFYRRMEHASQFNRRYIMNAPKTEPAGG